MRSKVRNPAIEIALRANALSKDTLNSAIDGLLAHGQDDKPLYYKFFELSSEDMRTFRFCYLDVSMYAVFLPFFGKSISSLTEKKAKEQIRKFVVMSAIRAGFTARSITIEEVRHEDDTRR